MNNAQQEKAPTADRRWLLAIDGSPHADRCARYVARWAGPLGVGEVWIVNAQPITSYRAYALNRESVLMHATEAAEEQTRYARAALDAAQVRHRLRIGHEDPADSILDAAKEQHADEILLGTRGLGPVSSLVLGSVAYKVVHLAGAPVTVVPPAVVEEEEEASTRSGPHRLLLAVDGSEPCRRAIDYVRGLASVASAEIEVHLVHVRQTAPEGAPGSSSGANDRLDHEEGRAVLRTAEDALATTGLRCKSHLAFGPLAESMMQLATANHCARIVMGSRGLGALENLALGSAAYKVLHYASLPVTIVT